MTADDIDLTLPQTILQKKYATSRLKFRSHDRKNKAAKPNRKLLTKWDHLLSEDVEQELLYKYESGFLPHTNWSDLWSIWKSWVIIETQR